MKRGEIRVCVLRVGGTNCDAETRRSFEALGVRAEVVHVNEVVRKRSLLEYDVLVFPGGFSYGDYVRAGAIWAKWILAKLGKELKAFVDEGRLILGICNGFQVLVETGLLPGFEGISPYPEAGLATNFPPGYNCRWISLKHENNGKCAFTGKFRRERFCMCRLHTAKAGFCFRKRRRSSIWRSFGRMISWFSDTAAKTASTLKAGFLQIRMVLSMTLQAYATRKEQCSG